MNAEGIIIASGTVAFVGSMKKAGRVPDNTVPIIFGTSVLAVLASLTRNSPIAEPVKWLAILMLLSAVIRYVPAFNTKGKKNG